MPRNISFALTTDQIRQQTKTVTRRKGWKFLKAGDVLNACVKCMGLKPGEKIERLGQIYVKDVSRESLAALYFDLAYGKSECDKEGFPEMTGPEFITMFCAHMGGLRNQEVTRIEFGYLPIMECTDQLNCLCWECESARVVNLRTTLIRCILDGEMNQAMQAEAIAVVTHSYGTDRWMIAWGIEA